MIAPRPRAQRQLSDLCSHLRAAVTGNGALPEDVAVFARHTDAGGYEVRLTEPLTWEAGQAAPRRYVEATDPPQGWNQWSLPVGRSHWPDRLGIRAAGR